VLPRLLLAGLPRRRKPLKRQVLRALSKALKLFSQLALPRLARL
jgi:hypothetical protein